MSDMPDLSPATARMAALLGGIQPGDLTAATPCPKYALGDLVDHVGGLTIAFTGAAEKTKLPGAENGPSGDAGRLGDDWRVRIAADLARLAAAWGEPDAWTGMTQAGPIEMPGEVAGVVALNELVVHGWDVARATGQPFDVDDDELAVCQSFYGMFQESDRGDAFGSVVEVPDDATLLDQVIALSGRDPNWGSDPSSAR